jgi:hypothetical protein
MSNLESEIRAQFSQHMITAPSKARAVQSGDLNAIRNLMQAIDDTRKAVLLLARTIDRTADG